MSIDDAMQVASVMDSIARVGRHLLVALIGAVIGRQFGRWVGKRAYVAYTRRLGARA